MGTQSTAYTAPGVTFQTLNSQATAVGPGAQGVLCLIGTAPQGSSQPKLFTNLQALTAEYGSNVQAGSTFNLEPGAEIAYAQTGAFAQLNVIAIRVGATLAAASVPQQVGGGTAFAFQAQAEYAGRNNLTVVVGTATYFTAQGAYVQSIAVYDNTPASAIVIENYSGNSPENIAAQINTQSQLVNVTTAGGGIARANANKLGQVGTYTLQGAVDGSASVDQDYINAINLAAGINCDFIAALSGSPAVQQGLFNHVIAMAAINKFRQAFVGFPYTGQTEAAVVAQAVASQNLVSSQYVCMLANTGGYRVNPVTNLQQIYDGFYWAAALAAKKAINNPADPLTRKSLQQLIAVTEVIPIADLLTLGSYGIMSLAAVNNNLVLYDGLTLANPGNFRKENIVAQQDRLSAILLVQVGALIGVADPISDISAIQSATINALNAAVQQNIIIGYNIQDIAVTQTSPGVFTVSIRYFPRVEIGQINFLLQLSLTIP